MITPAEEISVRFIDAGHLLGSASIELTVREEDTEKKIVFSGDIEIPASLDQGSWVSAPCRLCSYGIHLRRWPQSWRKSRIMWNCCRKSSRKPLTEEEILWFLLLQWDVRRKCCTLSDRSRQTDWCMDMTDLKYSRTVLCKWSYHDFSRASVWQFWWRSDGTIKRELIQSFPGLKISVTSDDSKSINYDEEPKVIISASGMWCRPYQAPSET